MLQHRALPAERCAHADAVSTLDGQGVLVTELVPGVNARTDRSGQLMHFLGDLLGQVHALPAETGAMAREAGAWHHLTLDGGGRHDDLAMLQQLLADAERRLTADERPQYDQLREELARVDDCRDLPRAFIHPDPCTANTIVASDAAPVLIDWTGAGRGPRVASLANLIGGCADLRLVDAAIAGYRRHVQLDDGELEALAGVVQAFPMVIDCWYFIFQDAPLRQVVGRISTQRERAAAIAKRARAAFEADSSALAEWDVEPSPARREIEGQGTLL
jgi:Ser/Thr protein kinase RdoA (MazF antagonist)